MKGLAMLNDRFQFKFIRETTDEEYCQINEMITGMDKIEFINSTKGLLVEIYKDIMNLIDDYKGNKILSTVLNYYLIIKVQNFLSSVRSYEETFSQTLISEYGKATEIYNKFNELKGTMCERSFSYRFIDVLHNCAQYRTIPMSLLSISAENKEKVVKLIVKKQDLLADEKIKGETRNDLIQNCDDEIDLLPHITNMLSYLLAIHEQTVFAVINESKYNEFFKFETTFDGMYGSPVLLDTVNYNHNDRYDIRPRFFNFNGIKTIISDLNETFSYMQN